MKKLLSALLALVLLFSLCPVTLLAEGGGYNGFYDGLSTPDTATPTEAPKAESEKSADSGKPKATDGILTSDYYLKPYAIKVDTTNQVVTVFSRSAYGRYDVIEKQFLCSTGTSSNPTPAGTFTLSKAERKEWRYFKTYKTYVKYAVHITGNYFFHSLLYSRPSEDTKYRSSTSYKKLGSKASHGCIRLYDDDCKWLYDNCAAGTLVLVTDCEKDKELTKTLKKNLGK